MKVGLLDSTLREGEQSPNVSFTTAQKIKIVNALDEFGIEYIEIGHPAVSADIKKSISIISKLETKAEKVIHSRALKSDIDDALLLEATWIGIFFGTSDISLKYKFGIDREVALSKIKYAVKYAKDNNLKIRFTAEDATRTEVSFLIEVAQIAEESGADRFSIADTVGVLTPDKTSVLVKEITAAIKIPVHIHCHNDLGMATANSIIALKSGAKVADVSINGLGERSGIASLAEVAMILKLHFNVVNNWDLTSLIKLSDKLALISGIPNRLNQPIVGKYAFTHKAGLHTKAVIKDPKSYEGYSPEIISQNREILLDNFTGKDAVADRLNKLKIDYSYLDLNKITSAIKKNNNSKPLTDNELLNFI